MSAWYGFDPGGEFGVAELADDGEYSTCTKRSINEAIELVQPNCIGLGIDSVLWWSSRDGGGRLADDIVRQQCISGGGHGATVATINSLQGAMFIPGYLAIRQLRTRFRDIKVTEAHPKALLYTLNLPVWRERDGGSIRDSWGAIRDHFKLRGPDPEDEHQRDAIVCAVAAREGLRGNWASNLREVADLDAVFIDDLLGGRVEYFWPHEPAP